MTSTCLHCGDLVPVASDGGDHFCCKGCKGAYTLIQDLGLKTYYERRTIDPDAKTLRPEDETFKIDYSLHAIKEDGQSQTKTLYLMVEGIHCAACVWLIETILAKQPGVLSARVNMSTRRLVLKWKDGECDPTSLIAQVRHIGYRLVPFDPALLKSENEQKEKALLRALSVAGFAAANVMLFSVSVWAGYSQGMQESTRDLMHWLSALVALPAVAFSGRPFFNLAISALKANRLNMDVPISLAVLLAAGMSLFQVINAEEHVYFDSAISLLFFLLIGRYLDMRARGRARGAAEYLLGLNLVGVSVLDEEGNQQIVRPEDVKEGMTVLCSAGERIAVDGIILEGQSDVDTSLITGESVPVPVKVKDQVFAGTSNLSGSLKIRVSAKGEGTLLAEIVRLMEEAEAGRAEYVAIADRVARYYAPVVHLLAIVTFAYWFFQSDVAWDEALLHAIAVLIITCPCALALAVPVVQVIASARLMRHGVLVKSGTALERLARIGEIVFDKTGTLTKGQPVLVNKDELSDKVLSLAGSIAAHSKHPLSRALRKAVAIKPVEGQVREIAGCGLQYGDIKLGSREWCGQKNAPASGGPELWLSVPENEPVCFKFEDVLRNDAEPVIARLKQLGFKTYLFSGDRKEAVLKVAQTVKIDIWQAECSPSDKCEEIVKLDHPLMVGDGLNDAPALAAAYVSLSPSTAIDVSQNTADCVFQGDQLKGVLESILVARKADRLIKQNFALAFLYNSITIPLAMLGYVTPLIAAIAMSTSSLVVIANALRLSRGKLS